MYRRNFLMAASSVAGDAFTASRSFAAVPCPPPMVQVTGGSKALITCPTSTGTSAISKLSRSMSVGTWSELNTISQNDVLGVGNVSGSMIHYCNSVPWNSFSRRIEIIGMDHNWGSVRYACYDEASNQFILVANDVGFGSSVMHGYDHTEVNPFTGDLYHRHAGAVKDPLSISRKLMNARTAFTNLPTVTTNYAQIGIGACWWSGAFSGAGSQGCFILFNSGDSFGNANDGQIVAYDPLTNNWFFNKHGMAPNFETTGATYHSVMEYSFIKNCAVYGGGNDQPNKLWRLNANGTFSPMPAVPFGTAVGIQRGNLVCDPATGNFLLLSAGQLWELNPAGSGMWIRLSGARTPPAGVGIPGPSNPEGVISCSMPQHGVVAYITQSSWAGGRFFLYKHA